MSLGDVVFRGCHLRIKFHGYLNGSVHTRNIFAAVPVYLVYIITQMFGLIFVLCKASLSQAVVMFLGAQSESEGAGYDAPEKCNWHLRNETLTTKNPKMQTKKAKD